MFLLFKSSWSVECSRAAPCEYLIHESKESNWFFALNNFYVLLWLIHFPHFIHTILCGIVRALQLCGMGREEILPKCHAAQHPSCPGSLLRKDKVFQFKMCAGRNVLAEHLHRNHQSFWVSSEVLFRDHLFGLTDKSLTASITLTSGWAEYVSARLEQQRAAEPAAGKVHQGMTDG